MIKLINAVMLNPRKVNIAIPPNGSTSDVDTDPENLRINDRRKMANSDRRSPRIEIEIKRVMRLA